ncbi:hypothetical protein REPUB_Repub02eG0127100 [Reevesia pubescens]
MGGIGVVIRNSLGQLMGAGAYKVDFIDLAFMAEAFAARQALILARRWCNKAAYDVARFALQCSEDLAWLEECPEFLQPAINTQCDADC